MRQNILKDYFVACKNDKNVFRLSVVIPERRCYNKLVSQKERMIWTEMRCFVVIISLIRNVVKIYIICMSNLMIYSLRQFMITSRFVVLDKEYC